MDTRIGRTLEAHVVLMLLLNTLEVTYATLKNSNEARAIIKSLLDPTILWQGDRIKCMKSATSLTGEKRILMKRFRFDRCEMINDDLEIFRPCMCKPNFHSPIFIG
jgi:hypothetical protein